MDFYFTDRKFNLIEIASTDGQAPYQLSTAPDFQSVKAAARTLSGTLIFTREQANRINQMAALGNYVLYHDKFGKDRFMTIMDIRHDPLNGTHDFTAEDAGVDLINETVGAYTADKAYNIAYYINKFTSDSGFEIGTNEISTLSRKLKWDSTDETSLARILSVATQFDAELDFSFEISGTNVVKRYINIYKHRGADNQVRLYLDKDINNIVTTGDIYDLYTSVYATGGTPEGSDKPITLKGYKWTDPDGRYELGADGILRDTVAVQLWSRILSNDNPNPTKHHLQRSKSYEASTQASLLQSALGGLKKAVNPAVNYEVDIAVLPENIEIGDTVHIVDDNEDLYLSARVLELKYDYALEQYTATLGDYLIEVSTVDEKLKELADDVKNMPKSVQYYPWIRYADDADGNGFSMFPTDKAYMAVIYGKTSTPSDNPSDYAGKWQKTLGNDGIDGLEGPAGKDGKTSYFHKAYANSSDGKTDFSITDPSGKAYLGTCSDFTKADPVDPANYLWQLVKGDKGKDGIAGKDGVSVKSTVVTYQLGTSGTTKPTSTWSSTVPTLVKGQYLWTKTTWNYSDSTSEDGYQVTYIGKDGNDGNNGLAGKDGVGIKSTTITYQSGTSGTVQPTGTWVDNPPSVTGGNYLWTRTVWSYTDGTSESGYSVAKMGEKGDQGPKGDPGNQGIPGTPGVDGRTPYTHWAYANSADGTLDFNPDYKSAIGLDALNITNWAKNTPMSNSTYKFNSNADSSFKVTGRGTGGYEVLSKSFPAKIGDKLRFTVRYTNRLAFELYNGYGLQFVVSDEYTESPTSTSKIVLPNAITISTEYQLEYTTTTNNVWMQLNFGGVADSSQVDFDVKIEVENLTNPVKYTYMGTYSDYIATDSTNPSDYAWALIKGADGAQGTPGKAGADGKTPYFHTAWADSQDGKTNFSTTVSLGKKYLGTYTDFTVADSTDPTRYKWVELAGAVEQHVDDAINKLIPPPSSGISYPSNPKKGQQHWLTDANSKPKGLFQYDGSKWVAVPVNADTISANTLNGMTINGVTINGSTINSPNINVPFNNVPTNPDEPEGSPFATFVSGTTKLTSNLNISGNIMDGTNKTPQWVKTLVSPQGFSSIISTPDASKALSVVQVSLGSMFLSEWHSDVTANDGFVSSYLKAGDATTYERKDVIKDTANFKDAVIRYSRKGTQVNVGFSFTLLNDTGWVGLSTIPKGYTPASLASVGITCPSLSFRGYTCVVYPNSDGWRLIPTVGQGKGGFQGTVSYVTYDDYPYNDAVH